MNDTFEQEGLRGKADGNDNPPEWISTDELEAEVFNAIAEETSYARDGDSEDEEETDEDFGGEEEFEDEEERRRSALRVLATMRPQLAELLGAQPAK